MAEVKENGTAASSALKRKAPSEESEVEEEQKHAENPAKKARLNNSQPAATSTPSSINATVPITSTTLVVAPNQGNGKLIVSTAKSGPQRTSSMLAPTMLLSGHGAQVYTAKFNPQGNYIASGSHDRIILLWKVYGECDNFATFKGHTGAVLELAWSRDGDQLYSASSDKTGALWDVEENKRIKRFRDHKSFVNSICPARRGEAYVVTGSDDCTAMLWDVRVRGARKTFENELQVLSVAFSDDAQRIFTGGIDNDIKVWDIRTGKILYKLEGHADSVTGMELSPDGAHLLSNGMDNTVRIWDVRPYAPVTRLTTILDGAKHDMQKNMLRCSWSPDGTKVSAGSADRLVYVWDVQSRRLLYKLPGHAGSVNEVDFHPTEPILLSCSDDKKIYMGEIQP
jgi:Prp8 binding protein